MSDKRPSDMMQPSSKRRAAGQVTKDDYDEEDEDQGGDPGEWKPHEARVDPEIAKRRKVRVRRAGAPDPAELPPTAEQASVVPSNPFSGVELTPPQAQSSNPFAGFSLTAPAPAMPSKPVEDVAKTPEPANSKPVAEESDDALQSGKDTAPPTSTSGFGSYSSNAFAALTSSAKPAGSFGGFGGFGGFGATPSSNATATPSAIAPAFTPFGSTIKPSSFSFGTGSFPNIAASAKDGDEGEEGDGNVEVFAESTAEFKPVVQLPESQKNVNGEEEERVTFTADCTLYEFISATNKWSERGKGEFRLNEDKTGQTRMLMRQTANYRLLLNAKVYSGMAIQLMPGDVGVSFGCHNAATPVDAPTPDKAVEVEGGLHIKTWAIRIKNKENVMRLRDLLILARDLLVQAPDADEQTPPDVEAPRTEKTEVV